MKNPPMFILKHYFKHVIASQAFLLKCCLLLMLTGLLAACAPSKKEMIPEDILPMSEMATVLADIHLTEGHIANQGLQGDSAAFLAKSHYVAILIHHQVEFSDFQQSMDYYIAHPAFMEKIYEEVQEILNVKQGRKRELPLPTDKDTTSSKINNP